jgi:hypothetical protein
MTGTRLLRIRRSASRIARISNLRKLLLGSMITGLLSLGKRERRLTGRLHGGIGCEMRSRVKQTGIVLLALSLIAMHGGVSYDRAWS